MAKNILEVLATTTEDLITKYGNKSKAIRGLHAEGYEKGDIARALDIRYQHVRNVLSQPLKKS
jgi:hypothetical protein